MTRSDAYDLNSSRENILRIVEQRQKPGLKKAEAIKLQAKEKALRQDRLDRLNKIAADNGLPHGVFYTADASDRAALGQLLGRAQKKAFAQHRLDELRDEFSAWDKRAPYVGQMTKFDKQAHYAKFEEMVAEQKRLEELLSNPEMAAYLTPELMDIINKKSQEPIVVESDERSNATQFHHGKQKVGTKLAQKLSQLMGMLQRKTSENE